MYSLSCAGELSMASRSSEEIYVLDLHRVASGLVSISSDQRLQLINPDDLQRPATSITTNHGNLTSARVVDWQNSVVATAGQDGTVSVWDLRKHPNAEVARIQASEAPIISLACHNESHSLAVGTELQNQTASIVTWDMRAGRPNAKYVEVHSDDVTVLEFHPVDPSVLLSGSTDGLVNVCDTKISDEDEVVIQTFSHSSIHHAGFLNATDVFALSHDEKFGVYSMAGDVERGSALVDFGDIREVLGCQYVANVKPKIDGSGALMGAGAQQHQSFNLIHLSHTGTSWGPDRETAVTLPGAHGEELVRAFCPFDEYQVIFTGGEDGKIKAWRAS